jgi:hypothetical protein
VVFVFVFFVFGGGGDGVDFEMLDREVVRDMAAIWKVSLDLKK